MDEFTVDAFVNREDPIPVVTLDRREGDDLTDYDQDDQSDTPAEPRTRDRLKKHGNNLKKNFKKTREKASERHTSVQDRLLEKLLHQVIPIEDQTSNKDSTAFSQSQFVSRPSFNITTMSNNFRRFNARIGVVFVFQSKAIRLLSWTYPTHTLSFLAIYSFICLDPYLLTVVPLVFLILGLLIPSFIARHPAPPSTISSETSTQYPTTGPPLAPAPTVKPAKELSKDFFRNMRDLQNSMEDFSRVHDKIVSLLAPPTNFSNEALSSALFFFTFATALIMFIASHLLPWRIVVLIVGWTLTALGHPTVQHQFISTHETHIVPHEKAAQSWLNSWIDRDIILDSAPQTREVEIFELEKLSTGGEWESWLFSTSPYDPLSEVRIRHQRPQGTRFFEDVRSPDGWEWSEKKWALDLWSREWVEERIITGVEVETEGERWVYDLRYETEYENESLSYFEDEETMPKKGKEKKKVLPSWEEGSDAEGSGRGRRGEWRRRRWVRMVKRKWQAPRNPNDLSSAGS
ncbi:integral peroxisomal membrane peroxin-domain-containing protein [Amylocarpus encephaloides]|uniref:Integral peroxisomal membrane peroxin-domain-containing protein n=1 Tax=Amylocarpus encephaloides TaxID=45428 RepID=A0A9P7YFN6_9HELO|nr:integral peroxisomal membrane peroxin-domain-containing protein [Amylocarpus encephaloides]